MKDGLKELENGLSDLKTEIKKELNDLKTDFKKDLSDLKKELKQDIKELKQELKQEALKTCILAVRSYNLRCGDGSGRPFEDPRKYAQRSSREFGQILRPSSSTSCKNSDIQQRRRQQVMLKFGHRVLSHCLDGMVDLIWTLRSSYSNAGTTPL
ncbi:hypothetical protein C8F01DRAFT_1128170 [Mycena amicta]|nr:hypothetical protein C8F01DRAFT_1128170 [Mycena amicta]